MKADEVIDLALKSLPIAGTIGGAVAWIWAQKTGRLTKRAETESKDRALLAEQFQSLRDVNLDLDRQLGEITPKLSQIRKEYAEAVQQIIFLYDQLRELSEKHAALTSQWNEERRRLLGQIELQRAHIQELREKLRAAGVSLAPMPALDGVLDPSSTHNGTPHQGTEVARSDPDETSV